MLWKWQGLQNIISVFRFYPEYNFYESWQHQKENREANERVYIKYINWNLTKNTG